ncbi:hypothetical protein VUN84_16045 [Micrococcaceae bacterium Sec5.8]
MGSIGSFNVTLGFTGISVTLGTTEGRADSGNLDIDLEELVEDLATAMAKSDAGFGIFIDEMQDLDEKLLGALIQSSIWRERTAGRSAFSGSGCPICPES